MKLLKAKLYEMEMQKQNEGKQELEDGKIRYWLGQPNTFLCIG